MAVTAYKERFEIEKSLGEGGFAKVFLAREKGTDRKVALKVLKDAYLKDSEVVERFRREVFAVASISSPHVVGMHDFGISGDEVYIAMEFVEGPTLRDISYERTWTAQEVHVVIGQIAQALAAAHRQDIVHRDLKPENVILVQADGGARHVKVLDFGLAKLADLERKLGLEPLTRAGMCFGTPQYMAPELIRGRPFDKSVDLYALAVIAFELLGGFLPWDGIDPREVLISVVKNPPPHLRQAHPTVEKLALVDKFLQRVLSKNPADRPKDASTFFREFEDVLLGAKKPPRPQNKQVPAEDAVFASVWAASLNLRRGEDATEIDSMDSRLRAPEVTRPGGDASKSGVRRRLMSGWNESLPEIEIRDTDEDLRSAAARVVESSSKANPALRNEPATEDSMPTLEHPRFRTGEPTPSPLPPAPLLRKVPSLRPTPTQPVAALPPPSSVSSPYSEREHTQLVKKAPSARAMLWWVVPLLLGLVVFAAAVGYVVGRR